MARIVFVTWYGGGNLAPALGIGSELRRRGHTVSVFGQTPQRRAVEAAGMAFTPYAAVPDGPAGTAAERQLRLIRDTWMNPSLADGLVAQLARDPADAVVTDYMLAGVLARSDEFGALAGPGTRALPVLESRPPIAGDPISILYGRLAAGAIWHTGAYSAMSGTRQAFSG